MPTTLVYHDGQAYIEAGPQDPYPVLLYGANGQPLLVDASGNVRVVGNVANGDTDTGNPVKIGAKYLTTLPTYADGDRVDLILGLNGQIGIEGNSTLGDTSNASPASIASHGSATARALGVLPVLFNGTSADRARNNVEATLLASAARTATTTTADQVNYNGKGVAIHINVTVEGAATLTLTIQGKDPISGNYYDIITGIIVYTAATDAPTITRTVWLYPGLLTGDFIGIAATVNGSTGKNVPIPRTWRATITPADATTTTYSLAATTLL